MNLSINETTAWTQFGEVFQHTYVYNIEWIISAVLLLVILILITRDVEEWKTLALPITIVLHILGITPSLILYLITGIVFVINNLSIQIIGNMIRTTASSITTAITTTYNKSQRGILAKGREETRIGRLMQLGREGKTAEDKTYKEVKTELEKKPYKTKNIKQIYLNKAQGTTERVGRAEKQQKKEDEKLKVLVKGLKKYK